MRKLAKIIEIDSVSDIPNADKIVTYHVGGWTIVGQRNEYKPGDRAILIEIDSWVPTELAPFLSKGKEPRVYKGIRGEKLRTIRLKKQLSQGLLLPLSILEEKIRKDNNLGNCDYIEVDYSQLETQDLSGLLGIIKWEAEVPAQLAGTMKGNFPSQIPKTDQERVQNLAKELSFWKEKDYTWEVTEKLEGSSMTVYVISGEFGVCSRNIDLKETQDNTFWKVARKLNLEQILKLHFFEDVAIQGELVGPGIQGNIYNLTEPRFYLFDVYLIAQNRYMTPQERKEFSKKTGIPHVPVFETISLKNHTIESLLKMSDGYTVMSSIENRVWQEGLVFKCNQTEASFKAVSNIYLEGEK